MNMVLLHADNKINVYYIGNTLLCLEALCITQSCHHIFIR
jgi:hypothetical protein